MIAAQGRVRNRLLRATNPCCGGRGKHHRAICPGPEPTLHLPKGLASLADVPDRCQRKAGAAVCGGPWRTTETGVTCVLCSASLIVLPILRASLRARFATALRRG